MSEIVVLPGHRLRGVGGSGKLKWSSCSLVLAGGTPESDGFPVRCRGVVLTGSNGSAARCRSQLPHSRFNLKTAREIKFLNVARCLGDVAAHIRGPPL